MIDVDVAAVIFDVAVIVDAVTVVVNAVAVVSCRFRSFRDGGDSGVCQKTLLLSVIVNDRI